MIKSQLLYQLSYRGNQEAEKIGKRLAFVNSGFCFLPLLFKKLGSAAFAQQLGDFSARLANHFAGTRFAFRFQPLEIPVRENG